LSRDQPLDVAEVALDRVARDVCDAVSLRYRDRPLALTVSGAQTVRGDEAKLRQALLNLVLNAAQAVDGAGHVRVETDSADGMARVRVSDDGPGVAPEIAARLFEPFATGKATGTGLGLAIARRIVERHGGSLRFLPLAHGACFEARLPPEAKRT